MFEIQNQPFAVKTFRNQINKDLIRFNYPIQRQGNQWNALQKSYLIHSIASPTFPIPPIYFLGIKEEIPVVKKGETVMELSTVRQVLDGKQRLTTIFDFVTDEFALHNDTPEVTIDAEEFELAGKKFSELDEAVQDSILSKSILSYTIDGETADDEEIEDLFFRMNNGSSLTKQQKAKAQMGTEWAKTIQKLGEHSFITNLAAFSKTQLVKDSHLTALMQTMMMMDEHTTYKDVTSSSIASYGLEFKDDSEYKEELVEKIDKAMDYLSEVFDKKEKVLLKKVNFPMTLITAVDALEKQVNTEEFYEWTVMFKKNLDKKFDFGTVSDDEVFVTTDYLEYTGNGSTDKHKADGRLNAMRQNFSEYIEKKRKFEEADAITTS
ncbi:DUF262 domain-containing protein [Terribacillus saccharophilus]|uniref:DUF262 domain-containing protein n=1 Tax=Terribacillus saccharophilus TaxID=361277 RepID=UPI002989F8F1|nr:DUF262 domain-containing protein [Terribacillus saccharophilus]MCM3227553.1 DUF262 domain-containing protein [Terribacillus saccharophilus]